MPGASPATITNNSDLSSFNIMACDFQWEQDGVIRRYSGTLSSSDILASARKTETHIDFCALRWMLTDMTAVTDVVVSNEAFEHVLMQAIGASFTNSRIRIAFVCTHPDAILLIAKFAAMQDCYETRLFAKFEPAMAWARRRASPDSENESGGVLCPAVVGAPLP